jgi:hypothetical protein
MKNFVPKTAKIEIAIAPKKACLLPLVSEITFMIKRPINEPKGKID